MEKFRLTDAIQHTGLRPVMAGVMDVESLCQAFDGCAGVFHTSSSLDPGGLSGYSVNSLMLEQEQIELFTFELLKYKRERKNLFCRNKWLTWRCEQWSK